MIVFLVNLAAAVALLLWSVRLIRTGVERAFLPQVRRGLKRLSRGRVTAASGGMLAAMLLQSGTAAALIASGFVASGAIASTAALALVLGAELGSALMARVLFLPIGAVVPLLLLSGILVFFHAGSRQTRQAGRILIGFALVLVSLGMIQDATAPIAGNPLVAGVSDYLEGDLLSAFVLGAGLAWAMHSSLATVLMVASFAASGLVTLGVAVPLVLGANLGGALIPFGLLRAAPRPVRVVMAANLIARGALAVLALAVLALSDVEVPLLAAGAAQTVLLFHIGFGVVMVLLALPVVGPLLSLAGRLVRPVIEPADAAISALDPLAMDDPRLALACAQRELMRMAETTQTMLAQVRTLFRQWDADAVARIEHHESEVDRMHYELKLYVSRLRSGDMTEAQLRKCLDLVTVANGLEEAADRIAVNLLALAHKMNRNAIVFSEDGLADVERFHDRVASNAQLALGVLTTGDPEDARQLVAEKDAVRRIEQGLQERHLRRLQARDKASVASTNMHQETLRLLKQINASFSYVAYPIIEEAGELLETRLASRAAAGGNL